MKKVLSKTLLTLLVSASILAADTPLYDKVGIIDIVDHKAMVAGSKKPGEDVFHISLDDTGIITGHICGCTTAAFIITKKVLKDLYPKTTPLRRGVNVAISSYNMDIIDAITYITGTRFNRAETNYDFILDPSLQGKKNTITLKFTRKDTHKTVTAVINREKVLTKEEALIIQTIKPKVQMKKASKKEIMKLANTQKNVVKRMITDLPSGSIVYK